jgi:hypothetical protein
VAGRNVTAPASDHRDKFRSTIVLDRDRPHRIYAPRFTCEPPRQRGPGLHGRYPDGSRVRLGEDLAHQRQPRRSAFDLGKGRFHAIVGRLGLH